MARIIRRSQWRPHPEGGRLPALLECVCGHRLELWAFTNTCARCGRDYNQSGQALAPRSQWGEETGETAADILAVGAWPVVR
jgi:hypothetical protein